MIPWPVMEKSPHVSFIYSPNKSLPAPLIIKRARACFLYVLKTIGFNFWTVIQHCGERNCVIKRCDELGVVTVL